MSLLNSNISVIIPISYIKNDNLERLFIGNSMNKGVDYDRETGKFKFSGREYMSCKIIT